MALLERMLYDDNTAQLIGEYYVPTHADRPEFDISFIDNPDYALNPIGARGVGESASAVRPQPSPPPSTTPPASASATCRSPSRT